MEKTSRSEIAGAFPRRTYSEAQTLPTLNILGSVLFLRDIYGSGLPTYSDGTSFIPFQKLPSLTVAELNAESNVPDYMVAFANDGRRSGEIFGGGSGLPVWYDGTDWRTFFDNSVVLD
jgi:hypothetical protein